MNDKLEFALRLKNAMVDVGLQPKPGVLYNLFNTRYWGRSVSFQAVSKWLKGEAIPTQDKLQVLAQLLNVKPEVLRFGSTVRDAVYGRRSRWDESIGYLERETLDTFLRLPPAQRKVLREVILTFAKAYAQAEGEGGTGVATPPPPRPD
jgi:transcriptional regulator with XRE-family HTH domain